MKKQLLSKDSRSIVLLIIITGLLSVMPSCGGGGGGGGPAPSPVPPQTTASPPSGIYGSAQSVTLTSNKTATIYYSLDGNMPSVGSANTFSGHSPINNIQISTDTNLLQYFAVDGSGIQESVKSESYVIASGLASGPGDTENYFPLADGYIWNSRVTVTETSQPTITYNITTLIDGTKDINGVLAVKLQEHNPHNLWPLGPLDEYLYKSSSGVVYLGDNDMSDKLTPQVVPYHVLHFPLQTGTGFVEINRSGLDYGEDIDWDGQNEKMDMTYKIILTGFESVTVPAGTFLNSAKLEGNFSYTVTLSSDNTKVVGHGLDAMWLAPGIGSVKSISDIVERYLNDTYKITETEELTSAEVPAPFFGLPISVATATYPGSVAIGDFNGDGKPDLVMTCYDYYSSSPAPYVSVFLGDGTGSFGAATNYAMGVWPRAVTVADFNNDGKLDLAVVISDDEMVSILLGTGTGSFGSATNFAVGQLPGAAIAGDINNDGKQDLAIANYPQTVSILLGTGTGSFGSATNFTIGLQSPNGVSAGDFNNDGNLDLAVSSDMNDTVSILLGSGTGTFGDANNINIGLGGYPKSMAVGDFNNDSKLDLVVANYTSLINNMSVSILLGDGSGSFNVSAIYYVDKFGGTNIQSLAVGDFNGDGVLDVAVVNQQDGSPTCGHNFVLLGDGTGSFDPLAYFFRPASSGCGGKSLIGDFNIDGKQDLVVSHINGFMEIYLNVTQ